MRVHRRLSRAVSAATAFVLALAVLAVAQSGSDSNLSNIRIKNFGQVDKNLYRGAQPKHRDYDSHAFCNSKPASGRRSHAEGAQASQLYG